MSGAHLCDAEVRIIRRLRYVFGYTIAQTAEMVDRGNGVVARIAPGRVGKVPNDKLRQAFLESDVSASKVARRLGWGYDRGYDTGNNHWQPDQSRVRRALGIDEESSPSRHGSSRNRYYRESIDADTAVRIANAIGISPDDVGARAIITVTKTG